jgi:hypothetical protein
MFPERNLRPYIRFLLGLRRMTGTFYLFNLLLKWRQIDRRALIEVLFFK